MCLLVVMVLGVCFHCTVGLYFDQVISGADSLKGSLWDICNVYIAFLICIYSMLIFHKIVHGLTSLDLHTGNRMRVLLHTGKDEKE